MLEYIDGFRAEHIVTIDGREIFTLKNWDGRTLFQGSRDEYQRYACLYKRKVREHEERVRSSRREVV